MTPSIALPTLYREAFRSLATGKSQEAVLESLVVKGLPEPYARELMTEAFKAARWRRFKALVQKTFARA